MTIALHKVRSGFETLDLIGRPVVKTCGIASVEHALAAAEYSADLIGLVFAPSRRSVSLEIACSIRVALDRLERRPLLVGLYVNEAPRLVLALADAIGLDIVQLSGDEPPAAVAECAVRYPVLKALRFSDGTSAEAALAELTRYRETVSVDNLRFLVDAFRSGEYGGTGKLSNWRLAAKLAEVEPIVLAGGLNPGNVADAVTAVSPWAVDVSSGIETAGVKDPVLIRSFIAKARTS